MEGSSNQDLSNGCCYQVDTHCAAAGVPAGVLCVPAATVCGQATGVYIPVSPLLLEMLQWSELRKTPTGTAAAPDMLMLLRLNKAQLKTSALQEEVVSQV